MSPAPQVLAERAAGVLTLTLNRPEKMNALSAGVVDALLAEVEAARGDGTRLLVLRGNGKNFSAGFDFGGYESQSEGDLLLRFVRIEQLLEAVEHAPFDTLALAHGRNFGAGVDLVGSCARRLLAPGSTCRMPGLRFGLVLGSRTFARRVGNARARDVLQASKTFTAEEALQWNFATALVPQAEWDPAVEAARAEATHLAPGPAARLFSITAEDTRDADMTELVRSAAAPGLKDRIAAYLAATPVAPAKAGAQSATKE